MLCIVADKSWGKLLTHTTIGFLCNMLHGQLFTFPIFFKDENLFVSIVQVAIIIVLLVLIAVAEGYWLKEYGLSPYAGQ